MSQEVSRLDQLIASGRARPPRRPVASLPAPEPGPSVSAALLDMRSTERY